MTCWLTFSTSDLEGLAAGEVIIARPGTPNSDGIATSSRLVAL
jgi:hypothetical protein